MCTPIVINSPDLSGVDPSKATQPDGTPAAPVAAPASTPAGTGTPTPAAGDRPQMDTPALAADEGRVFVPGAVYPGAASSDPTAGGAPATTPSLVTSGTDPSATPTDRKPGDTPAADPITDQNTLLINSLTNLAHQFSDTTSGILQGQTDAANALKDGFLNLSKSQQDALDAANQLRQNTGQAARKPSYSLSMAKVQRANSQGAASTMLTGATGVPTNQLALGRAQLLGGAPA